MAASWGVAVLASPWNSFASLAEVSHASRSTAPAVATSDVASRSGSCSAAGQRPDMCLVASASEKRSPCLFQSLPG